MNVPLALTLWLALVMWSSCAETGSQGDEETTTYYDYDYSTVTGTPDYDYNATFDYYFVTGHYGGRNQASAIGRLPLELLLGLAVLQIWH